MLGPIFTLLVLVPIMVAYRIPNESRSEPLRTKEEGCGVCMAIAAVIAGTALVFQFAGFLMRAP